MSLSLDNHIAGGYFLVQSVERHDWMDSDLMPPRILSLSECLCPSVQVYWAWDDDGALAFGVAQDKLAQTHQELPDFDYPNVFLTIAAARHYAETFLSKRDHLHLIGIGLPENLLETFLQEKQQAYDPHLAQTISVLMGVSRAVTERKPLDTAGQALGYELLGYDESLGHSWLCSGIDREMHQLFGIRTNPYGLIDSLDAAMQVYDWIAEDEQRGHRAEPEPYYPWLLVEYPLERSAQ